MKPLLSPRQVSDDPGFESLKRHLIEATGLAYYLDKDEELAIPVAHRLEALAIADCATYLRLLLEGAVGAAELDALTADLTIGETYFFRHRELFDALRERVFPDLIERNRQHRRLRIWSAGCATGAEPYSLAILLEREFKESIAGWEVSILGTDINRAFLAQAQRAEFNEWHLRSMSNEMQQACFSRNGAVWTLHDAYRRDVSFQYHNLVRHPFPSPVNNLFALDLILCRNVTIYFDAEIVRRLEGQFRDALVDEGWLLVGHAEPNVELFREFQTVNAPGAVLYQKRSKPPAPLPWIPPLVGRAALGPASRVVGAARPLPSVLPLDAQQTIRRRPLPTLAGVRAKLDAGEWESAADDCRRLTAAERLNPALHFYHALVAQQMGSHRETEEALRRAIYLDRAFVLAHYYLGLVLQRNRDAAAAVRSFRNVLELLNSRDVAEVFADADGLTVGALRQMSEMHLVVLERS